MKQRNVFLAIALLLPACHHGSDDAGIGTFRVANAINDSPTLQASPSNVVIDPTSGIPFGEVGAMANIAADRYVVNVVPSDASKKFSVNDVDVVQGMVTTVFATGVLATGTQGGFPVQQLLTAPLPGQIAVQVVVASKASSGSDLSDTFYFTFTPVDGSSGLSPPQPGSVLYGEAAESTGSSGNYRIEVDSAPSCAPGNACPTILSLVFDSGPQGVSLPATSGASIYQLAVFDAGSGKSSLMVIDNIGHSTVIPTVPLTPAP